VFAGFLDRSMSAMDPILEAVENWRRKSSELAVNSNDAVLPAMSKAFDVMCTVLRSDADSNRVQFALVSLANERNLAQQYDALRSDPIRDLTYDMVDAVHLLLGEINSARNQSAIQNYSTPIQNESHSTIDATNSSNSVCRQGGLGDYEEDDFNYIGRVPLKREAIWDEYEHETSVSIVSPPLVEKSKSKSGRRNSNGEGGEEGVNTSPAEMRCVMCDEYGTHSVSGYVTHLRRKHNANCTEAGVNFRCACGNESRSSSHFASDKCHGANVTIIRDDERAEITEKKSESDEVVMGLLEKAAEEEGKTSQKEEDNAASSGAPASLPAVAEVKMGRKRPGSKERVKISSAEMRCVLCDEYSTHSVRGYAAHLFHKHDTTAAQLGIIYRCECGHDGRSELHFTKCHGISVTIVRDEKSKGKKMDEDGRKRVKNMSSTKLTCVLCEEYCTHSVTGYATHLHRNHQTNAKNEGIIFRCECGDESHSDKHYRSNQCPGASITVTRGELIEQVKRKRSGEAVDRQFKKAKEDGMME
ncbi:hypothetical protein PFISCL1PPCAC_11571, partial [Pristionchus fissidentatus]